MKSRDFTDEEHKQQRRQLNSSEAISRDDFETIGENDATSPDPSPDTTRGKIHRYILENADNAFRQREIVDAVDVPQGSVGPTPTRLERRDVVDHRGRYRTIADAEHAVASAGLHGSSTADDIDGDFSDEDVETWMDSAVAPGTGNEEVRSDSR